MYLLYPLDQRANVTGLNEETLIYTRLKIVQFCFLSKTSQIIFDLHAGFFHMEDEKGNKLHLFKKYFKIMFFFTLQVIIDPYCYSF